MLNIMSIVPIIIPNDPAIRAEVAQDLTVLGGWLLLSAILAGCFMAIEAIIKWVITIIHHIKKRKE